MNERDGLYSKQRRADQRRRTDHESTLKINPYTLTQQDFSNYSVWDGRRACRAGGENPTCHYAMPSAARGKPVLRQQLVALESDRRELSDKIDGARSRLEGLLQRIPE